MSTPDESGNGTGSPWNGSSSTTSTEDSEELWDSLVPFWETLLEVDRHLSVLDSRAPSRSGEIESFEPMVILKG